MKKRRSKKWDVAKKMPPLAHTIRGAEFDVGRSAVVQWLISRPEIMQLVFNAVKDHGDIVYDPETGLWQGVDYVR